MHYLLYSVKKKFVSVAELQKSNSLNLEYEKKNPRQHQTLGWKDCRNFQSVILALLGSKIPKRGKFHLIEADQSYWLKGHCLVVYCSGGLCPVYILAVLKTKTEKRNSFELRKNWKGKKIVSSWERLCLPRIALSFSVMVCSHDHNQGCELSRTAKLLNLYQNYFNKVLGWALFIIWNLRFQHDS